MQFSTPACTYSGNGQLQLTIRNDGSLRIDCFWIAPKGGDTQLIAFNLKPAQQDVLGLNTVWATYNAETNNEVEVFPCLIQDNKVKTGKSSQKVTCA